jgi:hypothetical protein
MPIPKTSREALLEAMRRFDAEEREGSKWQGWEKNQAHKFAISHDGRLYPVKEIIRMALSEAGTVVPRFSGGPQANGYVQQYGLEIAPVRGGKSHQRRNVWWVNQGQTFREESSGGFLWAPLKDKNDNTPLHWAMMQEVRAGDVIVSYRDKRIVAISHTTADCELQPRPKDLSTDLWEEDGRLVPAEYFLLNEPVPIEAIWTELRALNIPDGPIQQSGNPIKLGYLWRFSEEGLNVIRQASKEPWPKWAEPKSSPRFWWVNQGRNWKQQRDGGYLYVGRSTPKGMTPESYSNVMRLRAGDVILHYIVPDRALRAVSRVREPAQEVPRPEGLTNGKLAMAI